MKDIRCTLGMHKYVVRHVEDSAYRVCRRCGKELASWGITAGPIA